MGEAGRLTKRTPETDEQVTRLLMDGCTRRDTAAAIGIHEDTFRAWMIAHPDFAALVKKAEGACLREAAGIIQRVARGGIVVKETTTTVTNRDGSSTTRSEREVTRPEWTAAAWLLERRDPDNWGRKDTIRIQTQKILEETRNYAIAQGFTEEEAEAAVAEARRMMKVD